MKTYKINPNSTSEPVLGNVENIVIHFRGGLKQAMPLVLLPTLEKKVQNDIIRVDCYGKEEKIRDR